MGRRLNDNEGLTAFAIRRDRDARIMSWVSSALFLALAFSLWLRWR